MHAIQDIGSPPRRSREQIARGEQIAGISCWRMPVRSIIGKGRSVVNSDASRSIPSRGPASSIKDALVELYRLSNRSAVPAMSGKGGECMHDHAGGNSPASITIARSSTRYSSLMWSGSTVTRQTVEGS